MQRGCMPMPRPVSCCARFALTAAAACAGGPWVHGDNPGWQGDFTIDYNHAANHWGLYANNRLSAAMPYYPPLLDFQPKARQHAAMYNCSGTQ